MKIKKKLLAKIRFEAEPGGCSRARWWVSLGAALGLLATLLVPLSVVDAQGGGTPSAPVRALVEAGDAQVTFRVTKPAQNHGNRVVGYEVRKKRSGEPWDAWEALGTTVAAFADADTVRPSAETAAVMRNLINGVSYTFQIRAVNAYGPGPHVETWSVVPIGAPTPGTLSARAGDAQVMLSWAEAGSGGSTITGWEYRQRQGDGGYGAWTGIAGSGSATRSHTVTGLFNGLRYQFAVRAVTANDQKGFESESNTATPSTTPPQPASVTATRGDRQVTLSWTAGTPGVPGEATWASPTISWEYRTRTTGGTFEPWMAIVGSGAATNRYVVTGLVNGVSYDFEVRAINAVGAGSAASASATPAAVPIEPPNAEVSVQVRIVARKLAGGRLEFGLQVAEGDGSWGDRRLPEIRYFLPDARVDRWLTSSSLAVGTGTVRIVARKLAGGRVEFGLQVAEGDGSWGDRRLPRVRYFPPEARVDRWLNSSPLTIQFASIPDSGNSDMVPEDPDSVEPCVGQEPCKERFVVPVYFCAPVGRYSQSNMATIVADLDSRVHRFYDRESSGLTEVRLTLNGVVSPDMDWDTLFDNLFYEGRRKLSKCELEAIDAAGGDTQVLVLVSMQARNLAGYARYDVGPAVASLHAYDDPEDGGFHRAVAHELGHSLFGLDHTDDHDIRVVDCSGVEWSLMNSGSDCERSKSQHDPLDYYRIICSQRQKLSWPCTTPTPVVAGDTPRSYKQWRSYSATSNIIQKGVQVKAIRQNIPGNSDNTAYLNVACDYSDTYAEWGLFLYMNWGGVAFIAPTSYGYFDMSIRFSDKMLLEVGATEMGNNQFSQIPSWRTDTRDLSHQIIAKDGQNMTWFAYDSQGRLFSATFDTTGSAVAVQSVLNFCDSQQ